MQKLSKYSQCFTYASLRRGPIADEAIPAPVTETEESKEGAEGSNATAYYEPGRKYAKPEDTGGFHLMAIETLELLGNFSFVPESQAKVHFHLAKYNIDSYMFCYYFDGSTFEFFPKPLKVKVFIFEENYYTFVFTQPTYLGAPPFSGQCMEMSPSGGC